MSTKKNWGDGKASKGSYKAVINDQVWPDETLHTVLVETESIIDIQPLTPVNDDGKDYEALTPNHFLIGRARGVENASRRMAQSLANMIWRRCRKEYLPYLSIRSKWNKEQSKKLG